MRNLVNTIQIHLIFVFFALTLATSLIVFDIYYFSGSAEKVALQNGVKKLEEREKVFKDFLFKASNELSAIYESELFRRYIDSGQNEIEVKQLMLAFAQANSGYMQMRYIDSNGLEKIRVERSKLGDKPSLIAHTKLQNKSHRYYFTASENKPLEQVWFSALDLNIEFRQVETPYKPTMRAILPIQKKGKFAGVLTINFFMQPFIGILSYTPLYDMVIFNNDGETLYHYDEEKAWSAYSPIKQGIPFLYPNVGNDLLTKKQFLADRLVFKKFDIPVYNGLNVLMTMNKSYLVKQNIKSRVESGITILWVFLLSVVLSLLMVRIFKKNLMGYKEIQVLNKKLLDQSTTDYLTQLKNVKAFNKDIKQLIDRFERYNKPFSIAMLDIDDFKKINDSYGHSVGDKVLVAMGNLFDKNLRLSDDAYRIGGEEFVVLMPNTDVKGACHIAERLCIETPPTLRNEVAEIEHITVSIGVAEVGKKETKDSLFKRVDDLLYEAKERGKNQVRCQKKIGI